MPHHTKVIKRRFGVESLVVVKQPLLPDGLARTGNWVIVIPNFVE